MMSDSAAVAMVATGVDSDDRKMWTKAQLNINSGKGTRGSSMLIFLPVALVCGFLCSSTLKIPDVRQDMSKSGTYA